MTQVVNGLTSKTEMGGPMACMYLLGNPDHYKSHEFTSCYWRYYVQWVRNAWKVEGDGIEEDAMMDDEDERVVIGKKSGRYVVMSHVQDYVKRPRIYENINLYNWIRLAQKAPITK
ncbi:hypothetical protein FIBSPDRAFT_758934, partial [Athelia psychrophila]